MQLYNGDCLEVMKQMPDRSIDMVLTDPPYGTTACKWDSVIPFEQMWKQLKRVTKKNSVIALFGNEPFSSRLRTSNINRWRYDWIWHKPHASNALRAKHVPVRHEEDIIIFGCGGKHTYNPQMTCGHTGSRTNKKSSSIHKESSFVMASGMSISSKDYDPTKRFPKALIEGFSNLIPDRHHPTQKPVALMEYLLKTYTNEGDTVLDFTMGSGTTGVACKRLARKFIGIELDAGYLGIARNRINDEPLPNTTNHAR